MTRCNACRREVPAYDVCRFERSTVCRECCGYCNPRVRPTPAPPPSPVWPLGHAPARAVV